MGNSGATINFAGGGGSSLPPGFVDSLDNTLAGKENYHGIDRSTFSYTFDQHTKVLSVAKDSVYWIKGLKYTFADIANFDFATIHGSAFTDGSLYHVYFDTADGVLKIAKDTAVDLFNWAYVLSGFYNGSEFAITPEAHSHTRDIDWHINAHMTIGARYHSGFDLVGYTVGYNGTVNSTGGILYDEDIKHHFVANPTQARHWYRTAAGKYTWRINSYMHSGNATTVHSLNTTTYTLDPVASNRFVNIWVYVAGDDTTPWQCFIGETTYSTVANARAETVPQRAGFNLSPEMKLAYRLIYKGDGTLAELPQDYRTSSSLPSGFIASTTATQVSVVPSGTLTSTNTQAALEELDADITNKTTAVPHTWVTPNAVTVPSGTTDAVPPMLITIPAGKTAKLLSVRYGILGGTSATFKLQRNGADMTGYTGLSATTTPAQTDQADISLANGDKLQPIVTAVSGSPVGLSISIVIEYGG